MHNTQKTHVHKTLSLQNTDRGKLEYEYNSIIAILQSALLNNSTHKRAIEEGVVHANSIMFPYLAAF